MDQAVGWDERIPSWPQGLFSGEGSLGVKSFQFASPAGHKKLRNDWSLKQGDIMEYFLRTFWSDEEGQDVAEYSVMLAVILIIVVGTVRLIGSNAGNVFSNVGSAIK